MEESNKIKNMTFERENQKLPDHIKSMTLYDD